MALSRVPPNRFQVRQGKMSLILPQLPELGCLVTELDENGCHGRILFQYVPIETATAWRRALNERRAFHVSLDVPPFLNGFQAAVQVASLVELSTHTELDLSFEGLGPTERTLLQQSMLALATQKVRGGAGGALPEGMTAAPASANKPFVPPPPVLKASAPPLVPPPPAAGAAAVLAHPPAPKLQPAPPKGIVPVPVPLAAVAPPAPPPSAPPPEVLRAAVTMPAEPQAVASGRDTSSLLKLKKIGEVLIHMGQLNPDEVAQAVAGAQANDERIGRYLVRNNIISAEVLCRALALQSGLPMTDLEDVIIPEKIAQQFTHATMLNHEFVPFDEARNFVCVAAANPLRQTLVKELETLCGKKVEVFIAEEEKVLKLLDSITIKQQRKQRKHIRYDVSLPIKYQFCSRLGTPAEHVVHQGLTVNISEGGMLIEGSPSALGTPEDMRRRGMCVSIDLPYLGGKDIHAVCQLRAVREKEKHSSVEPKWLIGIELVEMSAEDRRRMKEICVKAVMSLQKKHGRKGFGD
ncbi:MAG TPA: PilZ domain-containing protein [Planctomycetota bacterium]|nr:PilZ domain-containing protein [Planctomycetota bacterium]